MMIAWTPLLTIALFGILSAIWIVRIYRKSSNEDSKNENKNWFGKLSKEKEEINYRLTNIEKLEGIALLVIFVIGTTPYSIKDLISGVSVDAPLVKFQLQNGRNGVATQFAPSIDLSSLPETTEAPFLRLTPHMLLALPEYMKRDLQYLKMHVKDCKVPKRGEFDNGCNETERELSVRISNVSQGINVLGRCLVDVLDQTNDSEWFREQLRRIVKPLNVLFERSIKYSADGRIEQTQIENISEILRNIGNDAVEYSKNIDPSQHDQKSGAKISDNACVNFDSILNFGNQKNVRDTLIYGHVYLDVLSNTSRRPYFSILFATILGLDKKYSQAISVLDRWDQHTSVNVSMAKNNRNPRKIEYWHTLRVKAMKVFLFNEWIKDQSMRPLNFVEYEENFRLLKEYVEELEKIEIIKNRFSYYDLPGRINRTMSGGELGYPNLPNLKNCKVDKADDHRNQKLRLFAAYNSAQYLFVRRGIDHPAYKDAIGPSVNKVLVELARMDYACVNEYYNNRGYSDILVALTYRLYGMAKVKQIKDRRQIGDNYNAWLKEQLEIALSSFRISLSNAKHQADLGRARRQSWEFSVRIKESGEEWIFNDVERWIDKLEPIADRI